MGKKVMEEKSDSFVSIIIINRNTWIVGQE